MKFDAETLRGRLARLPMLKAFFPLAAGIALAEHYILPGWIPAAGFILCGAAALLSRTSLPALAATLLFGWMIARPAAERTVPPYDRPLFFECIVSQPPSAREERIFADARLTAWSDDGVAWHEEGGMLLLRADSALQLRTGDRILCTGRLRDFPSDNPFYRDLMIHRGYAGRLRLTQRGLLLREAGPPPGFAARLHAGAAERIARLHLAPEAKAAAAAMVAGDRSLLTPSQREAYARSGTSHLLAVSGLHVGIVFFVVNFLTGWLALFRRGHLLRNGAVIAAVWLYAATTGLSPSVVRAATMCTGLQFALASGSTYLGLNILAATAAGMLLLNPAQLFDISYRLSFTAVAAVIAWGVPICRRLKTGSRIADAATALLVVGFVASVATAPLVSHTFGTVSLAGAVVNPPVVLAAHVTVAAGLLWIAAPVGPLAPLFEALLSCSAGWQEALVGHVAAWPGAAVEARLPGWGAAVCYLLFAAVTLAAWSVKREKSVSLQP